MSTKTASAEEIFPDIVGGRYEIGESGSRAGVSSFATRKPTIAASPQQRYTGNLEKPPVQPPEPMERDSMERREVHYSGRVQGVGFRYTARSIAQLFPVTGYVKNLP